ncbi:MAG: protein translocase subunit SecD [Chloroflexi bacterium]|nr:protein translocase subunit SecD [Chloroflexota bacterium]
MRQRTNTFMAIIAVLVIVSIYIDLPIQHLPFFESLLFWRPANLQTLKVAEGLDLQGGLQVLLQGKNPDGTVPNADQMVAAKGIIENRVNGLGVSEPLIQISGQDKIVVELPGITNPDEAIKTLGGTGLMEFVDAGDTPFPVGSLVRTDLSTTGEVVTPATQTNISSTTTSGITDTTGVSQTAGVTDTQGVTTTGAAVTGSPTPTPTEAPIFNQTFHTVMTGNMLTDAQLQFDQTTNQPIVGFTLNSEGARIFGDYTRANVGKYLVIVLDKRVISSPVINGPIPDGQGVIQGSFTVESARNLAIQLKYGSLPVPLEVVQRSTVGPSLGQDSVRKSLIAGAIGLAVVIIFMLTYYRMPGILASLALLIYATFTFAVFKLIPVTLTLPGIAGFILSVGMAVDANILIFERMKEEIRSGRTLGGAIEAGFLRAWPSIRDSNFSTFITCGILYWFGSLFGASIVKGFALTLFIGVAISMFTAITVTRNLLRFIEENFAIGAAGESRLRRLTGFDLKPAPVENFPQPENRGEA